MGAINPPAKPLANVQPPSQPVKRNNPLNIRPGSTPWQGQSGTSNNFCVFLELQFGCRAALKLLRTYIVTHKKDTLEKIINRWAPPQDNNDTSAYVKNVSQWTGINKDTKISSNDMDTLCTIASAMSRMEQGASKQVSKAYFIDVAIGFKIFA